MRHRGRAHAALYSDKRNDPGLPLIESLLYLLFVLPVSLDRIRALLAEPPSRPLVGVDDRAQFRVQIIERRKIDELLDLLTFDSGPAVPGGLYGYEQQRNMWSPVNHPLMPPYAAYTGGEFATIAIENVIGRLVGGPIVHAIASAHRSRQEEAAHEEVQRALAAFLAAQTPPPAPPKP